MKTYTGILFILSLCLIAFVAVADFHHPDRPTFGLSGGGIKSLGDWNASGALPLKAIDGFVGVRYLHDNIPDDETRRTHLRANLEGGHRWGRVRLRGYVRYGRESVMLQKGLYHAGVNLEVVLYRKKDRRVRVGLGTWAEQQQLLAEYAAGNTTDFGPRVHLTVKDKHWTINSAFLLDTDKAYQVRSFFDIEMPLFKVVYLALSGNVDYYSDTQHDSVDAVQWSWHHQLRLKF